MSIGSFYDLFEICRLRAIALAIDPTTESIYRMRCREYSEKYHTPLHIVEKELDPMFVLGHLYEVQYSPKVVDEELNAILEELYKIKDPNYAPMSKEELEDMVDAVMNKEIKRLSKNKRPTQETIATDIKKAEVQKPKSGSMSFGDLEKLEQTAESNKMGFDTEPKK
jgi:formate dehydrogenase maturation protein FdhE